MAEWIKMPLGMEVSLDPGDFVLDGDPAPPSLSQTVAWIKTALGTEIRFGSGHIVLDGDPAPFPNFRPMSIVAKGLHGSR